VQADAKRLKKAEAANGGFPLLGDWGISPTSSINGLWALYTLLAAPNHYFLISLGISEKPL